MTIETDSTRGLAELISHDAGRVIHRLDPCAMHIYEDEGPRFHRAGVEVAIVVIQGVLLSLAVSHPAQPLLRGLIADLVNLQAGIKS